MTRSRLIIAATAVVIAIGVGGFVVYDQVLRGDSAAALALPTASTASSAPAVSGRRRCLRCAGRQHRHGGRRGRRGHMEGCRRQRRRLPRPRAARQPAGRQRRGRSHGQGDRLDHHRRLRLTATTLTAASLSVDMTSLASDKTMRDNRLRREGLGDRRLSDGHVQADRPGRGPRGRPDRHTVGHHPDGRPDRPRRHEVGPDPGSGAACRRHHPSRRLDHVPALGLRDRRAEYRRADRLDRRRRHARVPGRLHEGLRSTGRSASR